MPKLMRYPLQIFNYFLFMLVVWYFSFQPTYHHLEPGQAAITVAFAHTTQHKVECRKRTAEELAALAPNMRNPMDCPRERSPLYIKIDLDDQTIFEETMTAPGLSGDRSIDMYRKVKVNSGRHHLQLYLNDNARVKDYTHTFDDTVDILPGQLLVVGFNREQGGFYLK